MAAQTDLFGQSKRIARPRNELAHCYALLAWTQRVESSRPELRYLFHIPNGGHRFKQVAASLERQGVKPGVPDYFLPVARGDYHGLFIEMKDGGSTSKNQARWIRYLHDGGYCARVCNGWDAARELIEWYLDWHV